MVDEPTSKHPACPDCHAAEAVDDPDWEHFNIPKLPTKQDVERFPIQVTELQHEISVSDILAHYELSEEVPCSMPGRHPHGKGYVVRTRCAKVLSLGSQCGRQLIKDFGRVEKYVAAATEYEQFGSVTKSRLEKLRAKLNESIADQTRLWGFRSLITREAPMLESYFRRCFNEKGKMDTDAVPVGIELWDYSRPEPKMYLPELRQFELNANVWTAEPPALSEQRKITKAIRKLEDHLSAFEAWAQQARRFVTQAGFYAAVELYDSEPQSYRTTVFDARSGQNVERVQHRYERVRERYKVTDAGLVDLSSNRLIPIIW